MRAVRSRQAPSTEGRLLRCPCRLLVVALAACLWSAAAHSARLGVELQPGGRAGAERASEASQIRIAQQFGLAYLPLMVMRQLGLIEKHIASAGLTNPRILWNRYPSGEAMNEALKLGLLDVASGGVVPLLQQWDQTVGQTAVKGIAALSAMPLFLNTRNPKVRSVADFGEADRIALPAVKTSIQAVLLQMAAARAFGASAYDRLDRLTVSMAHPDALRALLTEGSTVTAHFTSPPFQYQELAQSGVRRLLSSDELLGGPASFTVLWTRWQFRELNPNTFKAIYEATREAIELIERDSRLAAEIYIQQASTNTPVDAIERVLDQPGVSFSAVPQNIAVYARFMHQTGMIKQLPKDWRAVFFSEAHGEPGT